MATLNEIIQDRVDRLDSVPDEFIDVVNQQNSLLFKELVKLLDTLDIKDGVILQTEKNLQQIDRINVIINDVLFDGDYLEAVKSFIGEYGTQAGLVNDMMSEQFDDFTEKPLFNNVLKQSQRTALELLDESAIDNAFIKPLKDKLSTSILNGAKYSDVVDMLKENILGSDLYEPKMTSYAKRYAYDLFAIFDRSYTQIVTKDIEIELWEYAGNLIKDSRDFCVERAGKIFTTAEIESWADKDWQGKNPATDKATIFAYVGGFNCRHSLIPRNKDFVDL